MGGLSPIKLKLYMADGSCKFPLDIMEDVQIQVGRFFVPNDFIVMDVDEDPVVPIILGRPFLATAGAIIDVKEGLLTFSIGEEIIEYQFNKARG